MYFIYLLLEFAQVFFVFIFYFFRFVYFSIIISINQFITAIGASSPVLKPAFKTLEYPPFLLYLFDSSLNTFLTANYFVVVKKVFFYYLDRFFSDCNYFVNFVLIFVLGKEVMICSYLIKEFSIFLNNAFLCSVVLFNFL